METSQTMTYLDFLARVNQYYHTRPHQRYGQSLMNVLYSLDPLGYEDMTARGLDCFYTDDPNVLDPVMDYLRRRYTNLPPEPVQLQLPL